MGNHNVLSNCANINAYEVILRKLVK